MLSSAYLLAGVSHAVLSKLLREHGVSFHPRQLGRMAFLLQGSLWTSWLDHRESRALSGALEACEPPCDPVIIVGHWRTGSTLLHQLLALDPELAAPTNYQCCYPGSYITARSYVAPVLGRFVRGTRPMDNVQVGLDEPHEDEYALLRLCGLSPLVRLVFPESPDYFLLEDETFLPPAARMPQWEAALRGFVAKLAFHTGRRPVLKNPFHSTRVPVLERLFPEARYIHIRRDPVEVIPSTIHMWQVVGSQNALNGKWVRPPLSQVMEVYDRVETKLAADLAAVPLSRRCEVRFEDLESRPMDTLEATYARLGLFWSRDARAGVEAFRSRTAGYEKNRYELDPSVRAAIEERLASHRAAVLAR